MRSRIREVALSLGALAFAAPAAAVVQNIEVRFSDRLERNLESINLVERRQEAEFRSGIAGKPVGREYLLGEYDRLDRARYARTRWTGTSLVPDVADYTVENLIRAMVKENLRRLADGVLEGNLRLKLEQLQVAKHPVGILSSSGSTWASGTIEVVDAASGEVRQSHNVVAHLAVDRRIDSAYQGEDFAYYRGHESRRVHPVLAAFVRAALSEVVGSAERLARPVMVQ